MILKELEKNGRKNLFNLVDKTSLVNITKYAIYGTHFNIEGTLDLIKISGIKVENVDLLVKDLDGNEQNIKAEFNYSDDGLSFSTFGEINEGIDLENLSENSYYILLKVSY